MSTKVFTFEGESSTPFEINEAIDEELQINATKDAMATVYCLLQSEHTNTIKIDLKEGSSLKLFTYNNDSKGSLLNIDVNLDANSEFVLYTLINRNSSTELNQVVNLNGQNANVIINNYLIGFNNIKIKHHAYIYHNIPSTNSLIQNYCIAKDQSKVYCDNNTTIIKAAKGSSAYQKTKGMLVGKKALIEVNPNLNIDEYDVMAGHGATIGSLNKEDLFYLMSRGLSKERAEHLAVVSLVNPLLDQITLDNYKERIINNLEQILK